MKKEVENLKTIVKSKHGGYRENSGRKPKLLFKAREIFNSKVDSIWIELLEKTIENALNGDKDSLKFLIDQRMGRASLPLNVNNLDNNRLSSHNVYNLFLDPNVTKEVKEFESKIKARIYENAIRKDNLNSD